jgi:hypothetical protein
MVIFTVARRDRVQVVIVCLAQGNVVNVWIASYGYSNFVDGIIEKIRNFCTFSNESFCNVKYRPASPGKHATAFKGCAASCRL